MASSRFVEILDDDSVDTIAQQHRMSECDVKLEDVLADQEQQRSRSRSSTQSSSSRKSQEYDPRVSTSRDGVDSQSSSSSSSATSSPASSNTTSPTSPVPRIKRLRKFTLTGGFSR